MPAAFNEQNRIISLVCAVGVVVIGLIYTKIDSTSMSDTNSTNISGVITTSQLDKRGNELDNETQLISQKANTTRTAPILQPVCLPRSKSVELNGVCVEYLKQKLTCTPEDILNPLKHKIPKFYYQNSVRNNSTNETQNTIVNCIIAALLLTSLGAALLEFYRAKISPPPPENERKGIKPPLNRKCSLADLTVLKHHRKELVRRESILEHHIEKKEDFQTAKLQGGFKPSPLHRRCSFPTNFSSNEAGLGGGGMRRNSRNLSMANDITRKLSIANDGGPKLSMVSDVLTDDLWRRGSLVGEDSSPERRHHSRLVHRH